MLNPKSAIVVGNWKMNLLIPESIALAKAILERLDKGSPVQIGVAPPFTALDSIRGLLSGTGLSLVGQNICCEAKGAFTGEISASMLKDAGCDSVILGHSERRKYFAEDDGLINKKIISAHSAGLTVILCVGETLEQRENGQTHAVIKAQLKKSLEGLSRPDMENVVIAYEPIWAIGTGKNATPDQAQSVHKFIRNLIAGSWGMETGDAIRIQYGGSVNPENSGELLAQPDVDGALVGGASLDADSFCAIIGSIINTKREEA